MHLDLNWHEELVYNYFVDFDSTKKLWTSSFLSCLGVSSGNSFPPGLSSGLSGEPQSHMQMVMEPDRDLVGIYLSRSFIARYRKLSHNVI